MAKYKTIIGRAELVDFPALKITGVPAKTDTGAYSSSVHVTNIREETDRTGQKVLTFQLFGDHPTSPDSRKMTLRHYKVTRVENSFGETQQRYKVELKVALAGKVFVAPFTLSNRSGKLFPVLLGRTLLNGRFIVDSKIAHVNKGSLKAKKKDLLEQADLEDEGNET